MITDENKSANPPASRKEHPGHRETASGQQQEEQEYVKDSDPPLTEEDLEERGLSVEEADDIEWEEAEEAEEEMEDE